MSGYRCASTQAILELFEYNAAIQTPARLMIDAIVFIWIIVGCHKSGLREYRAEVVFLGDLAAWQEELAKQLVDN